MNHCTVVVSAAGERCNAEAVETFVSRSGEVLGECAEHHVAFNAPEPVLAAPAYRTRSRSAFLLVAGEYNVVVGYAHSNGPAVQKRARKLGASVVPNPNLEV